MKRRFAVMTLSITMICGMMFPAQASEEYDVTLYTNQSSSENFETWLAEAEEATGLNIDIVAAPTDGTSSQKITTILSTGDSSVDILRINDEMTTTAKSAGWLTGLSDTVMTEDILDNFATGYISDMLTDREGQIIGVPSYRGYLVMWVNQQIMDEVGITSINTLEEFEAFMEAASEKEGRYGYGGAWAQTYIHNELGQFVNMFGGDYFDWTNEGNRKALEFLKKMVDNGWTSVDQIADGYDQMNQKFMDGEYGVIFEWTPWENYKKAGLLGEDKLHIIMIPEFVKRSAYTDSWNYVLNNASEHKEAAIKLLQWLASPEGEESLYNNFDSYPARSDVAENIVTEDDIRKTIYPAYGEECEVHGRPMVPQTSEFVSEMGALFQQFVQDEITIDEFCEMAQSAVDTYR